MIKKSAAEVRPTFHVLFPPDPTGSHEIKHDGYRLRMSICSRTTGLITSLGSARFDCSSGAEYVRERSANLTNKSGCKDEEQRTKPLLQTQNSHARGRAWRLTSVSIRR
jgi:hypothetical protein